MTMIRDADHGTPASPAAEQVTLTIDGASVTVPAGTATGEVRATATYQVRGSQHAYGDTTLTATTP